MKIDMKLVDLAVELNVGGHEMPTSAWLFSALYQVDPTDYEGKEKLAEEMYPAYEDAIAKALDESHFQCAHCSWYFELGEEACDGICEGCHEDS